MRKNPGKEQKRRTRLKWVTHGELMGLIHTLIGNSGGLYGFQLNEVATVIMTCNA